MKRVVCLSSLAVVVLALVVLKAPSAGAYPAFRTEFDKRYMVEGTPLYTAFEGKANCNVCHVGMDKKKRNDYGKALDKLLSKEDIKDPEKIQKALEKVESEKVGETTFGALIKEGKLPVTKQ